MTTTKNLLVMSVLTLIAFSLSGCQANEPVAREVQPQVVAAQSEAKATQAPTPTPEPTPEPTPTPPPAPTPFSFAWISDTQNYTSADSDIFGAMTQWIADTQTDYNTVLTVQTGDLVNNPYREYQWQNSVAAFQRLPKGMHILTVAGNHDQLPDYDPTTPFLDHRQDTDFDPAHAADEKGYVYYTTFTAGSIPFIVFSVSYGFEADAADWILKACNAYPDHFAVLCFHNYIDTAGYTSVGKRLIHSVVEHAPNVRLILCGHAHGSKYIPKPFDDNGDEIPDRIVQQMMFNSQDDPINGVGFLRLLQFDPMNDSIDVITYSPVLDRYGFESLGWDQFGGRKTLTNTGLRDFLTYAGH